MTDRLDKALAHARDWSPARRAEAADLLLALDAVGQEPVELTHDELVAIDEALAQVDRGETADPNAVEALFARYRG